MSIFLSILSVIAAIVLVLVVLVQNSKGGGLSANFSSSNQIMGVRKTTDVLEKLTWGLAIAIMVFSIVSVAIMNNNSDQAQSEIAAPTTTPVNSTTSPDVSLPGNAAPAPAAKQAAPQLPAPAKPAK